jgi:hypothetical protein
MHVGQILADKQPCIMENGPPFLKINVRDIRSEIGLIDEEECLGCIIIFFTFIMMRLRRFWVIVLR